jgi:TRAP-type C4-dicarboxylate transport system substrate-binding protein
MDKTILIIMGVSIPIVTVGAIYAIMDNIQRTNEATDIVTGDKLLQDLKDGKITILQYYNIVNTRSLTNNKSFAQTIRTNTD